MDVSIPCAKVEINAAKEMLGKAIEDILKNASCSSSGMITKVFDHQRSFVTEDKDDIEDDLEEISARSILLLQPPGNIRANDSGLKVSPS